MYQMQHKVIKSRIHNNRPGKEKNSTQKVMVKILLKWKVYSYVEAKDGTRGWKSEKSIRCNTK